MTLPVRSGLVFAGIALVSIAAVGAALVSQHAYGMEPCPWCILQRLVFLVIALACAIAFFSTRMAAGAVIALSLCGAAAALWQHFHAAASASCVMTLADRIVGATRLDSLLPDVFLPRANCADAAVTLMGISYDFWSLALFVAIAAAASLMALRRVPRADPS